MVMLDLVRITEAALHGARFIDLKNGQMYWSTLK